MTDGLGYTQNEWKGLPNFQCNHCVFATTDEGEMHEHQQVHGLRTTESGETVAALPGSGTSSVPPEHLNATSAVAKPKKEGSE